MSLVILVCVVALVVHAFGNSLLAVVSTVKTKLAGLPAAVKADFTTVETAIGSVVAKVVAWVKSKL
jgi:hypothetical protein